MSLSTVWPCATCAMALNALRASAARTDATVSMSTGELARMGVGSKTLTEYLHGVTAVGAGRDDKDLLSAENYRL